MWGLIALIDVHTPSLGPRLLKFGESELDSGDLCHHSFLFLIANVMCQAVLNSCHLKIPAVNLWFLVVWPRVNILSNILLSIPYNVSTLRMLRLLKACRRKTYISIPSAKHGATKVSCVAV